MSHFIDGHGSKLLGYPKINLDHVAVLRPVREDGKTVAYRCLASNNEELGTVAEYLVEVDNHAVMPDTTGSKIMVFYLEDDGTMSTATYPVVGWRCNGGSADPISPVPLDMYSAWCLVLTTGWWVFVHDCECDGVMSAMAHARELLVKSPSP